MICLSARNALKQISIAPLHGTITKEVDIESDFNCFLSDIDAVFSSRSDSDYKNTGDYMRN